MLPLLGSVSQNSFPRVLTIDEENHYLYYLVNGNELEKENARNKLIEHNLRLVAHIVKKFENTFEDKDDLLSIGSIGLIKAIDSYKPINNARVATYASRCIENEILMYLRSNKKKKDTILLNQKIGEDKDGNEIHLADIIEDENSNPLEKVIKDNWKKQIIDSLKCLDDRELEIIKYRYGLDGFKELSQLEISKRLNISRSYVSRIEKRALIKLYLKLKESCET